MIFNTIDPRLGEEDGCAHAAQPGVDFPHFKPLTLGKNVQNKLKCLNVVGKVFPHLLKIVQTHWANELGGQKMDVTMTAQKVVDSPN